MISKTFEIIKVPFLKKAGSEMVNGIRNYPRIRVNRADER